MNGTVGPAGGARAELMAVALLVVAAAVVAWVSLDRIVRTTDALRATVEGRPDLFPPAPAPAAAPSQPKRKPPARMRADAPPASAAAMEEKPDGAQE